MPTHLNTLQNLPVQAVVAGDLWMERREQHAPLPYDDRVTIVAREHLDSGARLLYYRRPNEHRVQRLAQAIDGEIRFERVRLPPVGVPPNGDVHDADERLLASAHHGGVGPLASKDDHPSAPAEYRQTSVHPLA